MAEIPLEPSVPSGVNPQTMENVTIDSFDINPALPLAQREYIFSRLKQVLHAFTTPPPGSLPPTDVEHTIHLKDNTPFKSRPYHLSPAKEVFAKEKIDELLAQGVIRPSNSEYSSPIVIAPKPGVNQWRMCIDFRKLNSRTHKDNYPVPRIETCLNICKDADWLSIVDVKDAFHQIGMNPKSIPLTAFVTAHGLYEWVRMPFGLCNAPATFQRYMNYVLRNLIGRICVAFFDDCCLGTKGALEVHMDGVVEALLTLSEHKLQANMKKCRFGYKELVFVGHVIGQGTIKVDPSKIEAIDRLPAPQNITQLRSFLGMANYYHKFIKGYSYIALPLYQLTKKDVPYEWTAEAEQAFLQLKSLLKEAPVLRTPDFKKRFHLATDASKDGLGAVLSQKDDENISHPIAYLSRKTTPAESRYGTTQLECLAVVWAVSQLEPYLIDAEFDLETDHTALLWMLQNTSHNDRVQRWAIRLQEFSFQIKHRPGKELVVPDALSRLVDSNEPTGEGAAFDPSYGPRDVQPKLIRQVSEVPSTELPLRTDDEFQELVDDFESSSVELWEEHSRTPSVFNFHESVDLQLLCTEQRKDPALQTHFKYLEQKEENQLQTAEERKTFRKIMESFTLIECVAEEPKALYFCPMVKKQGFFAKTPTNQRLVVPQSLRKDILRLHHYSPYGAHLGVKRTFRRIAVHFYWPSLLKDVEHCISTCELCQREKSLRRLLDQDVVAPPMEAPQRPFELWSMDFIGPLPPSCDFTYILTIVEHFTGWLVAIPTTNPNASTVLNIVQCEILSKFGVPRRILSDRGAVFRNAEVQDFFKKLSIAPLYTTAYHPASNGKVERANGVIKTMLRTLTNDSSLGDNWSTLLSPAVFAYNTSPSERTGYTPFYLLHGTEAVTPGDILATSADHLDDRLITHPLADKDIATVNVLSQESIENLRIARQAVKLSYEKLVQERISKWQDNARVPSFNVGDLVLIQDQSTRDKKDKARLGKAIYVGPYQVKRQLNTVSYQVQALDKNRKPKLSPNSTFSVHLSRLRPFVDRRNASPLPSIQPSLDTPSPVQVEEKTTITEKKEVKERIPKTVRFNETPQILGPVSSTDVSESDTRLRWPPPSQRGQSDIDGYPVPDTDFPQMDISSNPEDEAKAGDQAPPPLPDSSSPPTSEPTSDGPAARARLRHSLKRQPYYGEATLSKLAPVHDLYHNYSLPGWASRPPAQPTLNPSLPPGE